MSDKLKIAMFGHKRIPSREGGVEIVVAELATGMAARGHSVVCYNRRGHNVAGAEFDGERLSEYRGVALKEVLTLDAKGLAAVSSSFFASLRAAFGGYDVVHIHAEGPAFLCALPKLFGKKVIVTVHGLDHQRAKWGRFASAYILAGEKNAVRFADSIIVLSEGVQRYFKEKYGRDTVYIPNGVRAPEILAPRLIREKYGLEKDGYILYLGRLVPEKGIHYLIEAYGKVNTDKRLVIAGGGSDTDSYAAELRSLAAGDERILFTGFVQGQLLGELYSNAYIYTLPSDLEGMPLSLLEAMSYGNCCLTSDIAECAEVTGEKALQFRKGDTEELRAMLQRLCDDPAQVEGYKRDAAGYICGKFNWDDVVERTLELYR